MAKVIPTLHQRPPRIPIVLSLTLLVGLALRLFFLWHLPFTFDEGAYLYDAHVLADSTLPGGDALAKSPLLVLIVAGAVKIFGTQLFNARAISLLANSITTGALYVFTRRLATNRLAIMAAVLWWLSSAPLILTVYGTTHALALSMATLGLAFWLIALQQRSMKYAVLTGLCFGLAYATRKTMLASAIPLGLLWLLYNRPRLPMVAATAGLLTVIFPWLFSLQHWYGWSGVREGLGWGYSHIAEQYLTEPTSIGQWGGGWNRLGKVALQLLTPLILLAVWARSRRYPVLLALSFVWLISTLGLYLLWPAALPDYLADLLPALVILSALGARQLLTQPAPIKWSVVGIVLVTNMLGLWLVYSKPWAGNYTRQELYVASQQLSALIPKNEPVLTAAVIAPYLSGHHVYDDIAHPLWYHYDFINPTTKETFLPSKEIIAQAFVGGEIKWVLADRLTDYAYFSDFLTHPAKEPARWQAQTVGPFQLYSVLK